MKKDDLIALLDAEWQKACALLNMQLDIDGGDFEYAMESQFEYLYWHDEWSRLYVPNQKEYWELLESTGEFEEYL